MAWQLYGFNTETLTGQILAAVLPLGALRALLLPQLLAGQAVALARPPALVLGKSLQRKI